MTHEELQTKVEELEALTNTGSNYALAETQARELVAVEVIKNEPELYCRTLLALCESLWQRGIAQDAWQYAEDAIALAEQIESNELQAQALLSLGNVYSYLSDYHRALEYYGRALTAYEALGDKRRAARVTANIGSVYRHFSDYHRALEYFSKSLATLEELGDKHSVAHLIGSIGSVYVSMSDNTLALEYCAKALAVHEELGNKNGVANVTCNIGIIYYNLSDYPHALEYFSKSLAVYEELGNQNGIAKITGNIGNVYVNFLDYIRALEYYARTISAFEKLGDKHGAARFTSNMGSVYFALLDYSSALEYFGKALATHEELGDKRGEAQANSYIGNVYAVEEYAGYDAAKAEEYLLRALSIHQEIGVKNEQYELHKSLAYLYEKQERWKEANEFNKKSYQLEKELNNEEAKKQAEQLNLERKNAEREKQLAVERAKHEATEQLLHNVLPPSIAQRMVAGESLIAERIPTVSVLFADIVNFTALSSRISAEELVEGLDRIFSAFDALAEKHGLEKIKTIGDAYMVVSGAPEPRADHAKAMVEFAFEMVEAIKSFSSISTGEQIQLRIGIHSGEVVAGVIGKKKFAYDLWGDAVNTASRMESHGEAGRIHVSEEFVRTLFPSQTLPDREGFSITDDCFTLSIGEGRGEERMRVIPRGEMDIKGKGIMKTYFLEKTS